MKPSNPKKILIIQLRRVGDVLLTLPTAGILRQNFPDARIDFLTEPPADQLVGLNPYINETLSYQKNRTLYWIGEIRKRKYDWMIDFHANGRTLMLTFLSGSPLKAAFKGPITRSLVYNHLAESSDRKYLVDQKLDVLKSLRLNTGGWDWGLQIPATDLKRAEDLLNEIGFDPAVGKPIGIAPISRRETREWLPERMSQTVQSLVRENHQVLFLWGLGERKKIDAILREVSLPDRERKKILVPPETSLLELSALIQKCSCVLAADNGPKNIAVALKVPTLTLSGPTNPLSFNPHNDPRHRVIRDEKLHCISCGLNQCPTQHECMQNISVDRVLKEIRGLLQISPAPPSAERHNSLRMRG